MNINDIFTPGDGDLSLMLLREIIGDWRDGSPVVQIFAGAMYIFNLGLLALASILFLYVAVVGTLKSAHDGEVMGRQWSSMWVPIRFALGIVLLVPGAGGLSAAQYIMLAGVGQGVAWASAAWKSGVSYFTDNQSTMLAVRSASSVEIREALTSAYRAELCVAAMNWGYDAPRAARHVQLNGESWLAGAEQFFLGRRSTGGAITWGGVQGGSYSADSCARVDFPSSNASVDIPLPYFGRASIVSSHAVADTFASAQLDAINHVSATILQPAAESFLQQQRFDAPPPVVAATNAVLDAAVSEYERFISTHYDGIIQKQNQRLTESVKNDANSGGWLTAGTWYYQLARVTSDINAAAQSVPVVHHSARKTALVDGLPAEQAERIEAEINAASRAWVLANMTTREVIKHTATDAGSMERSAIKTGMNSASRWLLGITDASNDSSRHFGYDPANPAPAIIQLKNVGDWMITATAAATGITVAGGAVSSIVLSKNPMMLALSKITSSDAGSMAAAAGKLLAGGLLILGAVLAFWLPLIPFFIWIGGVCGWIISTMEMLIATPVWVAAHLHPDGEGIAGQHAASGYMIALELIFRPVLMIFGLIISFIMIDPLLNISTAYYYSAFASAQADSFFGLFAYVAKIALFVMLCWTIINMTFKAIYGVPANVMKWIGGREGGSYNDEGRESTARMQTLLLTQIQRGGIMRGGSRAAGAAGRPGAPNVNVHIHDK